MFWLERGNKLNQKNLTFQKTFIKSDKKMSSLTLAHRMSRKHKNMKSINEKEVPKSTKMRKHKHLQYRSDPT